MVDSIATYRVLEGIELAHGWTLGAIREAQPQSTGGNFSVQFEAVSSSGGSAFCKVLDLKSSAEPPNVAMKLEYATKAFNYEAALIEMCARFSARRVVFALQTDEIYDARVPLGLVKYILFERADEDVRSYLDKGYADEIHQRFVGLRHAAIGVRELHGMRIAHQDLKPSNVLVFGCEEASHETKLGDLGRASLDGELAIHDESHVAGAYAYSPPELLYGQVALDFYNRRQACDLYQFGCLIAFVIAGTSINQEWNARLTPSERWQTWGDPYSVIYPKVRQVMNDAFDETESRIDPSIRLEVGALIRDLCDPDPEARGKVLQGRSGSRVMILSRLITRLNVLERKTRISGIRAA